MPQLSSSGAGAPAARRRRYSRPAASSPASTTAATGTHSQARLLDLATANGRGVVGSDRGMVGEGSAAAVLGLGGAVIVNPNWSPSGSPSAETVCQTTRY